MSQLYNPPVVYWAQETLKTKVEAKARFDSLPSKIIIGIMFFIIPICFLAMVKTEGGGLLPHMFMTKGEFPK